MSAYFANNRELGWWNDNPYPKLDKYQKGMQQLIAKWEKEYMTTNIKVGDRVNAPRHGRGTVLAIVGEDAWVRTEAKDYPLTFDVKKLTLVPKPRTGMLAVFAGQTKGLGAYAPQQYGTVYWDVAVVELTPEVRERIKDLL